MNNTSSRPDQSPASTEGPSKRSSIDLNADVGEGCGDDRALARVVSSFNIACGGHVGDPSTVRTAIELANEHGISVGAHPSYPDPDNFGRKSLSIAKETLVHSICEQIILVVETACDAGVTMKHVKPHGALYNDAAKDPALAETIAQCVASISERAPSIAGLMGPPSSALEVEAKKYNLPFIAEGFADRAYNADGSLVSRSKPGAVHTNVDTQISQALSMATTQTVATLDSNIISVPVETICLHGDTPNAAKHAVEIRAALNAAGIVVEAP